MSTLSSMETGVDLDLDHLASEFERDGYVIVSGLFSDEQLDSLQLEMVELQEALVAGRIDREHHGGDYYTSADPGEVAPYPHYVRDITVLSERAEAAFSHPVIVELLTECFAGVTPWRFPAEFGHRMGAVYQDARSGQESAYTRIGWHSDHQAYPNSDFFPAISLTFHLDATSPENGFLRVLPGSHKMSTDGMPLRFEKVAGEVPLYCDRGDVLLHHTDLWHSAARATEDPPGGARRHLRGSWFAGTRPEPGDEIEVFNKNAVR